MPMPRNLFLFLTSLLATVLTAAFTPPGVSAAEPVSAFPGAQGFGADTPGGRGGRVIPVTTVADSGPGSLRAALTATGPRIVVFRLGGTISLATDISIASPYVTVAGQTAPGDGILLRPAPGSTKGLLDVETHDVVIRHLRFRVGPGGEAKGLDVNAASRVVVDHNSFSWAVDENTTSYDDTADITFSWNIISEALSRSTHGEGEHSRGLFMSGEDSRNISAHHNLIAHNMRRNPEVNTAGTADIRNNVIYNWGTHASQFSDKNGDHCVNVVGNYFKKGPSTTGSREEIDGYAGTGTPGMDLYVAGNVVDGGTAARLDSVARSWLTGTECGAAPVTTTGAAQAYEQVLVGAGATLPRRDPVDERVIAEVRSGTGRIIDDPAQVGGWPTLAGGTAPADTDGDGMPDAWETSHGTDPAATDSAGDVDGDGWTNVEEWINSIGSDPAPTPTQSCT